jgi:hypothetical protein
VGRAAFEIRAPPAHFPHQLLRGRGRSSHRGPYFGHTPELSLLSLQLFLMLIGLSVLFLAVMVGERDRDARRCTRRRSVTGKSSHTDGSGVPLPARHHPDVRQRRVCRYFGRSRDDLIGRKFLDLVSEAVARPRAARLPR